MVVPLIFAAKAGRVRRVARPRITAVFPLRMGLPRGNSNLILVEFFGRVVFVFLRGFWGKWGTERGFLVVSVW